MHVHTFTPLHSLTVLMNQHLISHSMEIQTQCPLLPQLPDQCSPSNLDCCLQNIPPLQPLNRTREESGEGGREGGKGRDVKGGGLEGDRERWEGERITINRIMRQGPVHKDWSLKTVGAQGTTCIPILHTHALLIVTVIHSKHKNEIKATLAHKSLFFDLCSNSEPALPSTAGVENERQQKRGYNFNYRIM